ncbi:MAG: metallophosphoesterase [Candidatus Aerophobetes bacterium]|nr:metallophosphoesterase [Candidatus Aerophobetes bacterium]
MLIGVMADSHDNLPKVRQAVEFFNRKKVGLVLHAGDFIAPFVVIRELKDLACPLIGVFGNNDGEKKGLREVIGKIGEIHPSPFTLKKKKRRILLLHDPKNLEGVQTTQYDLIVYGHTHQSEIKRDGRTLLINPGECGGWLTGLSTIGLVDLDKMKAEIITLP